ncbi:MAG: hypothetical protein HC915_20395 [Anaerolineae bacterium]|nr:hypothetical protein [Anaerolineae bacterium]
MRSDIDRLMAERQLDAFIIPSHEGEDHARDYITGGVHASAMVVKKQGQPAVLVANHMEIDEAAKSGLEVLTFDAFNQTEILRQHGRGTEQAAQALWARMLDTFGIQGRYTLYGQQDIQATLRLQSVLSALNNDQRHLVHDQTPTVLDIASETKDAEELTKLREVGQRTSAVVRATRAWLGTHRLNGEDIVDASGQALTIGAVKRFVRQQFAATRPGRRRRDDLCPGA